MRGGGENFALVPNISVSLGVAAMSALMTGSPLLKKSMMVAKISGFMSRHSYASSSCLVTVMNSGPKNTAFTPSILNRLRILLLLLLLLIKCRLQCCGSGMFIPDPGYEFFHPGSRVKKIPDPRSRSASKNLSIFYAKIFC